MAGWAGAFVGGVGKDLSLYFVWTDDVHGNGVKWLEVAGWGWSGGDFSKIGSTEFDFVADGTVGDVFLHRRVHMGPNEMLPKGG